jgi:TolB-like protein
MVIGFAHRQARAQDFEKEVPSLAVRIGTALVAAGIRTAVAIDFTDLQARPTELGRYLAERISVELVGVRGLTVIDRANIRNILAEHRLSEEGLINPANAKKLGEFAGVDALVTGTVTVLGDRISLTIKAISASTAQIAAASQASFSMTPDLRQLQYTAVSRADEPQSASSSTDSPARDEAVAPISSRDIGSLKVVLRAVSPLEAAGARGVRFTMDLISREAAREIVVAVNGEPGTAPTDGRTSLRAGVVDQAGAKWTLSSTGLQGIGHVRGGVRGPRGEERYQPGDVAKLLALRDRLGREINNPDDVSPYVCGDGGCNYVAGGPTVLYQNRNRFVYGSTTTLAVGETVRVTMDFFGPAGGGTATRSLQFSAELVVGVVSRAGSTQYNVQTLSFDRIRLSGQ